MSAQQDETNQTGYPTPDEEMIERLSKELSRLCEENERLKKLLEEEHKELAEFAHDLGGCDHSVGICQCELNRLLDRVNNALFPSTKPQQL